jgi:hypothetical protein
MTIFVAQENIYFLVLQSKQFQALLYDTFEFPILNLQSQNDSIVQKDP